MQIKRGIRAAVVALLAAGLLMGTIAEAKKKITGTNKSEKINGTKKSDEIKAKGGNDKVNAKGGNDKVDGGDGKDTLKGQKGKDTLKGGKGRDKVKGGKGKDTLKGGKGKDTLAGNNGDDKANGGKGKDKVKGKDGDDNLRGGKGKDTVVGDAGADGLSGGKGKDTLDARDDAADTKVNGGPGTDTCIIDLEDVPVVKNCEIFEGGSAGTPPDPYDPYDPYDPGNPGPGAPAPASDLKITSFSGLSCNQGARGTVPPCPFNLQGSGADEPTGSVKGSATIDIAFGEAGAGSGMWTAGGFYNCTGNGTITVTFAKEQVSAPITCVAPGASTSNGPLTITTAAPVPCAGNPSPSPFGDGCAGFVLEGLGADVDAGLITGNGAGVVASGDAMRSNPVTGAWKSSGNSGALCQPGGGAVIAGGLTVTFGAEAPATIDLKCG